MKALDPQSPPVVVNLRRSEYDEFIGRPGKWGNPFFTGRDGTREQVIRKYRDWLLQRAHLMAAIEGLRGKRLGCYCKPLPCHGDVLVEFFKGFVK